MGRLQKVFAQWLADERSRLFLWLPVCLGMGMTLYYALPFEPSYLIYLLPALLLPLLALRRHMPVFLGLAVLAVLLVACGAAYAKWRTGQMDVRMLAAPLSLRPVEGTVAAIEHVEKGLRITLSGVHIENLAPSDTPQRVRISYRARQLPDLALGEHVRLRAALLPPSGPAMPNGFDFSRYFFFRHIGAVGYAIPPITTVSPSDAHGFFHYWSEARDRLTASIHTVLPGAVGAVAAGLITGDDSAMPDAVRESLRAANLLHIIAISGAHMVVIGGLAFVVLRAGLAFIPGLGLRPVVKTIAALLTLVIITLYLAITGFEISATRAYVMLALVLLAVILQRDPRPMRSIALAALLMLAIDPSDAIEPGFQLSFAATLALIAVFERGIERRWEGAGRITRMKDAVVFLLLTTVIAQAATTPIILFHFNNLSIYGIISNLVLTPVVSLILMPMVALYFVLLPFGWQDAALHIMAYGIRAMLWVGEEVSRWPHALIYLPGLTPVGIALASLGLCWICLWQTRVRFYGVPMVLLGCATLFSVRPPELFISPRAAQVAVATEQGYVLLRGRATGLFPELWANGAGQPGMKEYRKATSLEEASCERGSCDIQKNGVRLHFSFTVPDIKKGCPKADIWISGYYLYPEERAACPKGMRFIDRADFDREGSMWGWFGPEGLRLETTRARQGERIWAARPSPARRYGSPHASGTPGGTPHTQ